MWARPCTSVEIRNTTPQSVGDVALKEEERPFPAPIMWPRLREVLPCLLLAAVSIGCPSSEWIEYGSQYPRACYYKSPYATSFFAANNACRVAGARLASVHDLVTNAVVADVVADGDSAWIGLFQYEWQAEPSWADGSTVDFTYWDADSPSDNVTSWGATINGDSVTGQWATAQVDEELIFICATTD